jgi:hypothetical protein
MDPGLRGDDEVAAVIEAPFITFQGGSTLN